MQRKTLENMVPVTELANKASAVIQKVESGETQYVLKHNKVVAVLMDIELYLTIKELSATWSANQDEGEWEDIIDYAKTVAAVRRSEESTSFSPKKDFGSLLDEVGLNQRDLQ
jgi:prevent-host-death family protein